MPRILLIEDNPAFRQLLSAALGKAGHEVLEAQNGAEGLQLLATGMPEIVITDIVMEGKDGIETLMEMRKRFPSVPAIAMSGSSAYSGVYLTTAKHLGAVHVLAKPFKIEELLSLIGQVLARTGAKR